MPLGLSSGCVDACSRGSSADAEDERHRESTPIGDSCHARLNDATQVSTFTKQRGSRVRVLANFGDCS
uniref:Uncharacterized protein n=1 Tax=Arundo donax TaxID=35708 RepID=A0A0A9H324_ARUDO